MAGSAAAQPGKLPVARPGAGGDPGAEDGGTRNALKWCSGGGLQLIVLSIPHEPRAVTTGDWRG